MGTKRTKKYKDLTPKQCGEVVFKLGNHISKYIHKEMDKVHPKYRWLIAGRTINLVFHAHYRLTMNVANEVDKKRATELDPPKEAGRG